MESTAVGRISIACQWTSISPGISVRPFPAIMVTLGSAAIGSVEMRSMILPLTRTLDGADSEAPFPSKMRTFWNNVALFVAGGLPCARAADASPTAISGSAATKILRDIEFIWLTHTYLRFAVHSARTRYALFGGS